MDEERQAAEPRAGNPRSLNQRAAVRLAGVAPPELDSVGEDICPTCGGSGRLDGGAPCASCDGTGAINETVSADE